MAMIEIIKLYKSSTLSPTKIMLPPSSMQVNYKLQQTFTVQDTNSMIASLLDDSGC